MNNMKFLRGMGVGVAVGAAIGIACAPKSGIRRSPTGKAFKAVTNVMDNIADAIGL